MMTDDERRVIYEAIRFAVWAAGEGIGPIDGEPAACPDEFLFDYAAASGDEDYETLPERLSGLSALKDQEQTNV